MNKGFATVLILFAPFIPPAWAGDVTAVYRGTLSYLVNRQHTEWLLKAKSEQYQELVSKGEISKSQRDEALKAIGSRADQTLQSHVTLATRGKDGLILVRKANGRPAYLLKGTKMYRVSENGGSVMTIENNTNFYATTLGSVPFIPTVLGASVLRAPNIGPAMATSVYDMRVVKPTLYPCKVVMTTAMGRVVPLKVAVQGPGGPETWTYSAYRDVGGVAVPGLVTFTRHTKVNPTDPKSVLYVAARAKFELSNATAKPLPPSSFDYAAHLVDKETLVQDMTGAVQDTYTIILDPKGKPAKKPDRPTPKASKAGRDPFLVLVAITSLVGAIGLMGRAFWTKKRGMGEA